jgi:hypothetical protein
MPNYVSLSLARFLRLMATAQVSEAEKVRLREKMEKRRREQDARALQERLVQSEAARLDFERREAGAMRPA